MNDECLDWNDHDLNILSDLMGCNCISKCGGEPENMVILGSAGSGKSSLIAYYKSEVDSRGGIVAVTRLSSSSKCAGRDIVSRQSRQLTGRHMDGRPLTLKSLKTPSISRGFGL